MRNQEYAPAVHTPAHRKLEGIEQLPPPERWTRACRLDRESRNGCPPCGECLAVFSEGAPPAPTST
eukprot:7513277-Pyramimonas_sp.AAC.1